jgi:hypothetical protein
MQQFVSFASLIEESLDPRLAHMTLIATISLTHKMRVRDEHFLGFAVTSREMPRQLQH